MSSCFLPQSKNRPPLTSICRSPALHPLQSAAVGMLSELLYVRIERSLSPAGAEVVCHLIAKCSLANLSLFAFLAPLTSRPGLSCLLKRLPCKQSSGNYRGNTHAMAGWQWRVHSCQPFLLWPFQVAHLTQPDPSVSHEHGRAVQSFCCSKSVQEAGADKV